MFRRSFTNTFVRAISVGLLIGSADLSVGGKFPDNAAALTNHWAFQPIHQPPLPVLHKGAGWVQTPVDAFILAGLQERGLSPSPQADARTLIRRLYFDLLGLPPSAEEVEAFVRVFPSSPLPLFSSADVEKEKRGKGAEGREAIATLVDKLLASPHYGERWARLWLDVARYADTTGYLPKGQQSFAFAHAYRDYVVRALNEDLPYNEFVLEQLAADQLPPRDGKPRSLQAMGFLTLGRTFLGNRHDIIDDRIDVVTRGLMGLTVSCARCHDHPFDPVPTADYYALYGVFTNSLEAAEEPHLNSVQPQFVKEREVLRAELAKAESAGRSAQIKARLDELKWIDLPASERTLALADVGQPVAARVFNRGNPDAPGDMASRQFVGAASSGQRKPFTRGSGRLEMAQAIVSSDNPLTARVIVNRVWMHHFGEGLVRTPGDFGTRAEAPTHPELLDWLAAWFVENGWSLKKLHRLILTSAVYQQSSVNSNQKSVISEENLAPRSSTGDSSKLITDYSAALQTDPDNRLLWRMNRRRLDFESMRDALLAVAGRLDLTTGGLPVKLLKQPFTTRRTLYGYIDRQDVPGLFNTFDFPAPDALCTRRFETTVPQSSLFFLNSEFVREQSRFLATRPPATGKGAYDATIRSLFKTALQREPLADELSKAQLLIANADAHVFNEPAWQFGFGEYDSTDKRVKSFERLPLFQDGSWRAGSDLPDRDKRYLSHNLNGGHPGRDATQSFIRRWISPIDGAVKIEGVLSHNLVEGDGVRGLIVSSRAGELGQWSVFNSDATTNQRRVDVKRGDKIDFIVEGGKDTRFDHFLWSPKIEIIESPAKAAFANGWDARKDFLSASLAWDERPLSGLELLAHALLMSNEFFFVD